MDYEAMQHILRCEGRREVYTFLNSYKETAFSELTQTKLKLAQFLVPRETKLDLAQLLVNNSSMSPAGVGTSPSIIEQALRHYVIFIVPSGCHLRARASVVCLFHVLAFESSWRLLNL